MSFNPLAAQIAASPIPVFPEVGSMIVVSFLILPFFIASLIILKAILSFTEEVGFMNSHFPRTVAPVSWESELILIKGVFPISYNFV